MRQSKFAKWLGRNILMVLGLVALVGSALMYFATAPAKSEELQAQVQLIEALEEQQSGLLPPDETEEINEVVAAATGMSLERQEKDTAVAKRVMDVAATWKSDESYIEARDELIDKYGFTNDDPFMRLFMPGEEQGAYRTAPSGEVYFAYPGLNSQLVGFESTLVDIKGNDWSYFALATIRVKNPNSGTAENYVAVEYTVDVNGDLVEIMAYPSADTKTYK